VLKAPGTPKHEFSEEAKQRLYSAIMSEAAKNGDKLGCVCQDSLYKLLGNVPDGSAMLHELVSKGDLYELHRGFTRSVGVKSCSQYYDRAVAALSASRKT
jgi:hypothetical protein